MSGAHNLADKLLSLLDQQQKGKTAGGSSEPDAAASAATKAAAVAAARLGVGVDALLEQQQHSKPAKWQQELKQQLLGSSADSHHQAVVADSHHQAVAVAAPDIHLTGSKPGDGKLSALLPQLSDGRGASSSGGGSYRIGTSHSPKAAAAAVLAAEAAAEASNEPGQPVAAGPGRLAVPATAAAGEGDWLQRDNSSGASSLAVTPDALLREDAAFQAAAGGGASSGGGSLFATPAVGAAVAGGGKAAARESAAAAGHEGVTWYYSAVAGGAGDDDDGEGEGQDDSLWGTGGGAHDASSPGRHGSASAAAASATAARAASEAAVRASGLGLDRLGLRSSSAGPDGSGQAGGEGVQARWDTWRQRLGSSQGDEASEGGRRSTENQLALVVAPAAAAEGVPDDDAAPRWSGQPAWALAGVRGYR
jgi:hypothetical protein